MVWAGGEVLSSKGHILHGWVGGGRYDDLKEINPIMSGLEKKLHLQSGNPLQHLGLSWVIGLGLYFPIIQSWQRLISWWILKVNRGGYETEKLSLHHFTTKSLANQKGEKQKESCKGNIVENL